MRFYRGTHRYYCGVDLHARTMYLCLTDHQGTVLLHERIDCTPDAFFRAVEPYTDDLVVCAECIFCWYWLADLCAEHGITFILAHALYLKAIHGAKTKNDRIDSEKLVVLLRGGVIPQAYVYPPGICATRDLLRRRLFFTRKRSELLSHVRTPSISTTCPLRRERCSRRRVGRRSPLTSTIPSSGPAWTPISSSAPPTMASSAPSRRPPTSRPPPTTPTASTSFRPPRAWGAFSASRSIRKFPLARLSTSSRFNVMTFQSVADNGSRFRTPGGSGRGGRRGSRDTYPTFHHVAMKTGVPKGQASRT